MLVGRSYVLALSLISNILFQLLYLLIDKYADIYFVNLFSQKKDKYQPCMLKKYNLYFTACILADTRYFLDRKYLLFNSEVAFFLMISQKVFPRMTNVRR